MAVRHHTVTVGINATDLTSSVPDTRDFSSHTVIVQNRSGSVVFLGGPGVTAADYGYELVDGADFSMDLESDDVLFGVAAAPVDVTVLHSGV